MIRHACAPTWIYASLFLIASGIASAGTASNRNEGQGVGYDGIRLVGTNPTGTQMGRLQQAYNSWNACTSGEAPSFSETVGPGTGRTITVTMAEGRSDNPEECGTFAGNEIIIYEESLDDGVWRTCTRNDVLLDVLTHELGHTVGLKNGCQGIMQFSSWTPSGSYNARSLLGSECTLVKDTNKTPKERLQEECQAGNTSACQELEEPQCTPPDSCSPIVIDLLADGFRFTSFQDGTRFDINADQKPEWISWIERRNDDAFLAMDRDGNGRIDGGHELFGDATPMSFGAQAQNGYQALFELDIARGNSNGAIDQADEVYDDLLLWFDWNKNGHSEKGELMTLQEAGIETISVEYTVDFDVDVHGNGLRYRSWASLRTRDGALRAVPTVDVFFLIEVPVATRQ